MCDLVCLLVFWFGLERVALVVVRSQRGFIIIIFIIISGHLLLMMRGLQSFLITRCYDLFLYFE